MDASFSETSSTKRKGLGVVGKESSAPFPILDHVWEVFSTKGIRTVFLSIGASSSCLPDLDLAESIGCPLHYLPLNTAEAEAWDEVATIVKERKRDAAVAKHSFSAGTESKWIILKNLRRMAALPWWGAGRLEVGEGATVDTLPAVKLVEPLCQAMRMKDGAVRIDILKIDCAQAAPGLERAVVAAVLDAGFRPSLLMVNWSKMPDTDCATTFAAGHLQNSGYQLLDTIDSKFLYYFNDEDNYQICSWENTRVKNPLVHALLEAARPSEPTPGNSAPTAEKASAAASNPAS